MTDVTSEQIQNMTPEQLAALADAVQAEQAANAQIDSLLQSQQTTQQPVTPAQAEAPIVPSQSAVINGTNGVIQGVTDLAVAVEPVAMAINPAAGIGLTVAVAVVNSLEAMGGWLGLLPPGQATLGIQAEIVKIKQLIQS